MKHQIIVPEDYTFEHLKNEIDNGGQFIVYSYCISLIFAITLRRFSPAYFIAQGQSKTQFKRKYNILNFLFGWWQIPYGIIYTIDYIKTNNKGGLDVTEDILLNIDEQSFNERIVSLEYTNMLFDIPSKSDIKAMQKVVDKHISSNLDLQALYFGTNLNVPDEKISFTIGILTNKDFDKSVIELDKAIRKEFFKRVIFEYINLDPNAKEEITEIKSDKALASLLMKQGLKLI